MQDGSRLLHLHVSVLPTLSRALFGLLLILVGGMIPSAIIVPGLDASAKILSLPSTWQVPALLLCALVCGSKAGVISAIAYLTTGLFYLPIFHSGGNFEYISNPGFGYLIGFIPGAWITGQLCNKKICKTLDLTIASLAGLGIIQVSGICNLILGDLFGRWGESLPNLIYGYTFAPLPALIALCPAIAILAFLIRSLLLIE